MPALERPPRWGLIAIAVLLVANIGLGVLLVQRSNAAVPDAAPRASSSMAATTGATPARTAPSSAPDETAGAPSTAPGTSAGPGSLAVYGDGYSSGNSEGGTGAAGWPALVAGRLDMRLQLTAATLAGYVRPGSTGQTYPQLVQTTPPADASVTVVFGSRNDVDADPAQVQQAAASTFAAVLAADPTTALVVIGPCWSSATPPAALTAVAAAVRSAAEAAGASYVDPLAAGWFADPTGLVSTADGISLSDAGHAYLAGLIAPVVDAARSR